MCLSSKCETAAQQLWGSEGLSLSDYCLHWQQKWYLTLPLKEYLLLLSKPLLSSTAKWQLWLNCWTGLTARDDSVSLVAALLECVTGNNCKITYFLLFEKRTCFSCSKLLKILIQCHCPPELVDSDFPLSPLLSALKEYSTECSRAPESWKFQWMHLNKQWKNESSHFHNKNNSYPVVFIDIITNIVITND